ncbi:galactitol-1-phosphate 5-dehydrogenase [Botrimarina mediterranea]|uniref:Sorbitol dehydrogenase n=1 Tax=Botrimarina mediterranea TaxID=2528022 RepID=A0A518KAT5_9BACT|nr:galactitol-1-phosphate 5-dehydrogenase [Botrimarina mediterranea]QDV74902.1 Sorbitol dehydrogenase [Botrimarina mediterranea]QDV79545.1 Sorbitol dehydrogenase [Planctomycetes bacterium K2D]
MKALLLTDAKRLEYVDFSEPPIAADEVLVRVAACGVCGSDVHGYDGSTGRRIPPIVMGHEAAGVITQIGAAVEGLAIGERVTFDSTIYCGKCDYCRVGKINLCDNRQVMGVSCGDYRRHGAFAEYVAVPSHIVYRLPDTLPMEHAAMIEAVSVAVHAVRRSGAGRGDTAVVVGAGMIGLLVIQALRAYGAERVIAVDVDDDRLRVAHQLGASDTVHPDRQDPIAHIRELTGGRGAAASFEVVGATAPLRTAVECVAKGGSVTLVGNVSPRVEAPLQSIVTRELTLYGSCASQGEYPECIELMAAGKIDVAPLLSARAPLAEGPRWFERLYAREAGLMKVVLEP